MKALSIGDMQQRQLAILDAIDLFCNEHNLTYILIGGALLGAVREGKMIPWDDDIDIFMPRKDYRQFLRLFEDDDSFRLLDSSRVREYYYPFAKVCDAHTVMEENVDALGLRPLSCLGVGVDVFPLDYYPTQTKLSGSLRVLKQRALQGLCYRDFRYSKPSSVGFPVTAALSAYKLLAGLKGDCVNDYILAMDRLWGDCCSSDKVIDTWTYQVYSADGLLPTSQIVLEGKAYSAPCNCDKFLTECYGPDYMTPRNTQPDGHGVAYEL